MKSFIRFLLMSVYNTNYQLTWHTKSENTYIKMSG